jgi:hypothetical protein
MHLFQSIVFVLPLAFSASNAVDTSSTQNPNSNPNVWNFQIARKIIAAFQFNGMGMSIWEDQGVENTTVVSRRQFYVTPITEFLPNSSKCEYNDLTGAYFVSYSIQVWNDRLQLAAIDRLKQMQILVTPEQMQPLPFYQVRVIWNSAEQKLQKAKLSSTWNNNLQQQSIQPFVVFADDKETCEKLSTTLQNKPDFFTSSIALEYSLSASSTAARILTVKSEHFLNSQLMATLKTMDLQTPERYLTADDANRLTMQVMDNVIASQVVDGEYVPDADQLTLKDIVTSSLQLVNVDAGNFSGKMWESVFWDPVYARPDKVSSYLNKVLDINQGNHTVSKSSSYSDKDEGSANIGIDGLFTLGGKTGSQSSNSASYSELQEWLLLHNYDVEIKGEIFVPKSLSLKRLNLGVLSRQETIFTKSVQMHHVDAPGTLRVTVGAHSIVESEDIRSLRTRLDQLELRVGQLEPRSAQLEGRVSVIEPKLANAVAQDGQLSARIENLASTLTSKLGTKISSCKVCTYYNRQVHDCSDASHYFANTADVPGNGGLRSIQVQCVP